MVLEAIFFLSASERLNLGVVAVLKHATLAALGEHELLVFPVVVSLAQNYGFSLVAGPFPGDADVASNYGRPGRGTDLQEFGDVLLLLPRREVERDERDGDLRARDSSPGCDSTPFQQQFVVDDFERGGTEDGHSANASPGSNEA